MDRQNAANKEWKRDEYLKEFEDALIPSSQSSIEWQVSDEDNICCLTLPLKRRSRVDVTKFLTKKSKPNESLIKKINGTNAATLTSPIFKKCILSNSASSYQSIINSELKRPVAYSSLLKVPPEEKNNEFLKTGTTSQTNQHFTDTNRYLQNLKTTDRPEIIEVIDDIIDPFSGSTSIGTFIESSSNTVFPNMGQKIYANKYNTNDKVNFASANLQDFKKYSTNRYLPNSKTAEREEIMEVIDDTINPLNKSTIIRTCIESSSKVKSPNIGKKIYANNFISNDKVNFAKANLQDFEKYSTNRYLSNSKTADRAEIIDVIDDTINPLRESTTSIETFIVSSSKTISPNIGKKLYANNYNTKGKVNFTRANIEDNEKCLLYRNSTAFYENVKHMKCSSSKNKLICQPMSPVFNSSKDNRQHNYAKNESRQLNDPVLLCKKNIFKEINISDSEGNGSEFSNVIKNCSKKSIFNDFLSGSNKKMDEIEIVDFVNSNQVTSKVAHISLPSKKCSNLLHCKDTNKDDYKIVSTNMTQKNHSYLEKESKIFYNEPSEMNHKMEFIHKDIRFSTMESWNAIDNTSKVNQLSCRSQQGSSSNSLLSNKRIRPMVTNYSFSSVRNDMFNKNYCIEDTDSEKDFPNQSETSILIDAFSSPISDKIKKKVEENKVGNGHLEIENEYDGYLVESRYIKQNVLNRTGFEWVKNLNKTPEKTSFSSSNSDYQVQEAPDSSKKKLKKEGHADHLRKLIKSWQSDVAMFNHQIAQVNSNLLLTCLDSPIVDSHSDSVNRKMANGNIKIIQSQEARFDQPSPLHNDIKCTGINNNIENNSIGSQNNISPKTSRINKLQKLCSSLDVSPVSTSSLSSCKSFFVPQRHICLQITWIPADNLSSETIGIECRVADNCSYASKRDGGDQSSSYSSSTSNEFVINNNLNDRNYFVLLNQFGFRNSKLQIRDEIKIFAPWEVLEVEKLGMPTIFSSYFIIKSNNLVAGSQLTTLQRKIQIASRSCLCSKGHVIPSLCDSGELKLFVEKSVANKKIKIKEVKDFDAVLDKKKSNRKIKHHMWTVLEAIEYCGGRPDILVSITAWIRRVISSRYPVDAFGQIKSGQPSEYIIICQDPSGTFFIICIPNRPLASNLQSLINEGEGSVQTLSNLLVCHRITNSQDPSLFSLIHSLHISYKNIIEGDKRLKGLLLDSLTRPLQTFCYKFLVSVGKTELMVASASNDLLFKEQLWSIEETFFNGKYGQRVKLVVNIFYYFHPYLYVLCQKKLNEEKKLQKLTVKMGIWLPPWVCCDGTILASAVIRDILVTKTSGLFIDEYSSIIKMNKELKIKTVEALKLVPKLTVDSVAYDIVNVEGFISQVMEEDAYIWLECEFCLKYLPDADLLWCQKCGKKNITPLVKYSMEIEIWDPYTQIKFVKIKLCQKTIEMLLKACKLLNNVAYDSSTLHGKKLMPLICVIKSVNLKNNSALTEFNLLEVPY